MYILFFFLLHIFIDAKLMHWCTVGLFYFKFLISYFFLLYKYFDIHDVYDGVTIWISPLWNSSLALLQPEHELNSGEKLLTEANFRFWSLCAHREPNSSIVARLLCTKCVTKLQTLQYLHFLFTYLEVNCTNQLANLVLVLLECQCRTFNNQSWRWTKHAAADLSHRDSDQNLPLTNLYNTQKLYTLSHILQIHFKNLNFKIITT